jgi:hypothetical protein
MCAGHSGKEEPEAGGEEGSARASHQGRQGGKEDHLQGNNYPTNCLFLKMLGFLASCTLLMYFNFSLNPKVVDRDILLPVS